MAIDEKLAELDALLKALRFADTDGEATRDLEYARRLVAELRLELLYIVERIAE